MFTPLLASALLLLIPVAHALNLSGIANTVGTGLLTGPGNFPALAQFIVTRIWTVLVPVAIFLIIRFGFTLITSNDESKVGSAKRVIISVGAGLVLAFISQQIFNAVYVQGGSWAPLAGAAILANEVRGILGWVTTLAAPIGILMLVIAGLRVMISMGKEEMWDTLRRNILTTAAGLLLILLQPIISLTLGVNPAAVASGLGTPLPFKIIVAVGHILAALLMFLALIAIAVIIYAGVMMIVTVGSEEQYQKSRSLIVRATIGLLIIVLSVVILEFILKAVG